MVTGSSVPSGRDVSVAPAFGIEAWASTRRPYLDNLKIVLIAAIIAIHAVLGYASLVEVWTYAEFREVTLSAATQLPLFLLLSPLGFILMALLFLVAGLLTPPSRTRKGSVRFIKERMLRLGVPFLTYVLLVQPTLVYALAHPLGGAPGSYWSEYLPEGRLDTGPLWFVGVLLLFSTGYVAWGAWQPRVAAGGRSGTRHPTSLRRLGRTAVAVAVASFLVRLVYPYGGESGFFDLNFWEWPACLAVFALGIRTSEQGWLNAVPARLARRCRDLTLIGLVSMTTLLSILGARDAVDDAMGGWRWGAAGFASIEAVLTVFGSVWLFSVAQRLLDRTHRWGPVLARSAYGAFMVQAVFLLGFAVALRPLGLPAEAKAILVAVGAVTCSFGAAWLAIRHVPGTSRFL
jgi:hypothetical protein